MEYRDLKENIKRKPKSWMKEIEEGLRHIREKRDMGDAREGWEKDRGERMARAQEKKKEPVEAKGGYVESEIEEERWGTDIYEEMK